MRFLRCIKIYIINKTYQDYAKLIKYDFTTIPSCLKRTLCILINSIEMVCLIVKTHLRGNLISRNQGFITVA